jgi:hypothetical protein
MLSRINISLHRSHRSQPNGRTLNVHDKSVGLLPKLASDKELFCTEQDNW